MCVCVYVFMPMSMSMSVSASMSVYISVYVYVYVYVYVAMAADVNGDVDVDVDVCWRGQSVESLPRYDDAVPFVHEKPLRTNRSCKGYVTTRQKPININKSVMHVVVSTLRVQDYL